MILVILRGVLATGPGADSLSGLPGHGTPTALQARKTWLPSILTYPVRVKNQENEELYTSMWMFSTKMANARERCKQIAQDEDLMGYSESAVMYHELCTEISAARAWVEALLRERLDPVV